MPLPVALSLALYYIFPKYLVSQRPFSSQLFLNCWFLSLFKTMGLSFPNSSSGNWAFYKVNNTLLLNKISIEVLNYLQFVIGGNNFFSFTEEIFNDATIFHLLKIIAPNRTFLSSATFRFSSGIWKKKQLVENFLMFYGGYRWLGLRNAMCEHKRWQYTMGSKAFYKEPEKICSEG